MKKLLSILLLSWSMASQAQYVNIRLYDGVDSFRNDFWNNWKTKGIGRPNDTSQAFVDISQYPTKIRAILGNDGTVFDNGKGYKVGNTWIADTVLRKSVYNSEPISFTLTGLDDSSIYSVSFYASLYKLSGESTDFTTGNQSVTVLTDTNSFRTASFTNLSSKAGRIVFSIAPNKLYSALNGFTIIGVPKHKPVTARIMVDSAIITSPNSIVRVTDSSLGNRRSLEWMQLTGPTPAIFTSVSDRGWLISGLFPGLYSFKYLVSDSLGNTDTAFLAVNVKPVFIPPCPVCPPVVICPPRRTATGIQVTLNGIPFNIPIAGTKITYSDGNP